MVISGQKRQNTLILMKALRRFDYKLRGKRFEKWILNSTTKK